jgi:GNAT superfamily N-acetyltransferase
LLDIVPLNKTHLEAATTLVVSRYVNLRQQVPLLPQRYQESANILPLLRNIIGAGSPGVAAIRDGRLVGFLKAWLMPGFRGKRSVYSPEWGNGADLGDSRYIYEEMYQRIAADWIADGYVAHYISVFPNDQNAVKAWHWLGFGMLGVDALRGLRPVEGARIQVDIQAAGLGNLEEVMALQDGLRQYMKGSSAFFIPEKLSRDYFESWIQDPDRVIWMAYVDGEPVAFLRMGPANDDVARIIVDEKTTSIYGAFTVEKMRGKDIGTALLDHALGVARGAGYERCAVDFETMNLLGVRFWLGRGFQPVCLSLLRYVDERLL